MPPSVSRVWVEGSQWQTGVTPVTLGTCGALAVVCMAQTRSLAWRVPAMPCAVHFPPGPLEALVRLPAYRSWGGSWGQWLAAGEWPCGLELEDRPPSARWRAECVWAQGSMALLSETGKRRGLLLQLCPERREAGSPAVSDGTERTRRLLHPDMFPGVPRRRHRRCWVPVSGQRPRRAVLQPLSPRTGARVQGSTSRTSSDSCTCPVLLPGPGRLSSSEPRRVGSAAGRRDRVAAPGPRGAGAQG